MTPPLLYTGTNALTMGRETPVVRRWPMLLRAAVVAALCCVVAPVAAQPGPTGYPDVDFGGPPLTADEWATQPQYGGEWRSQLVGPADPLAQPSPQYTDPAYSGHSVLTAPSVSSPPATNWHSSGAARGGAELWSPGAVLNDGGDIHILPLGLMYQSYLAGEKESRISSAWLSETDRGQVWDVTLGGRVGLWRYGTADQLNPQGFQLDIEGAALVRLDPEANTDVEGADFRFGILGTWRNGPWAAKWGYYHISSHLGDEFLLSNPGFNRLNYVRDSAIAGISYDLTETIRLYSEAANALGHEGGALPWEFQYGAEYSSDSRSGWGGPYAAVNGHTREDLGWISSVNVVSGWQWRGEESQHRFRVGVQYYNGPALQYSFVGRNETLLGAGLWFDY